MKLILVNGLFTEQTDVEKMRKLCIFRIFKVKLSMFTLVKNAGLIRS